MKKAVVKKHEPRVIVKGSKIVSSSVSVAIEFKKLHKVILKKIENTIERNKRLGISGHIFMPSDYLDQRGKNRKSYFMNRKSFLEITMSLTGDRAAQIRDVFITEFEKLEAFQNDHDRIEARQEGKLIRHDETDVLQILIEYAIADGCSDMFIKNCYTNYTVMVNKALFIIPKGYKKIRESLEAFQLRRVAVAEDLVGRLVLEEIAMKSNYKEIYYTCKNKIVDLGEVVGRTEVPQFQIENNQSKQLTLF